VAYRTSVLSDRFVSRTTKRSCPVVPSGRSAGADETGEVEHERLGSVASSSVRDGSLG
jgi:hypothetical protein